MVFNLHFFIYVDSGKEKGLIFKTNLIACFVGSSGALVKVLCLQIWRFIKYFYVLGGSKQTANLHGKKADVKQKTWKMVNY